MEIKITPQFSRVPDKAQVTQVVYNMIKRLWRDSVRAFVLAVADNMMVDTGMSIASLRPLGI